MPPPGGFGGIGDTPALFVVPLSNDGAGHGSIVGLGVETDGCASCGNVTRHADYFPVVVGAGRTT